MCVRHSLRKVFEEGREFGCDACPFISLEGFVDVLRAALLHDKKAVTDLIGKNLQRLGQKVGKIMRALTAAKYQEIELALARWRPVGHVAKSEHAAAQRCAGN